MTMRYCASCDLKGLGPYTAWEGECYMGALKKCENALYNAYEPSTHHTYMFDERYRIACPYGGSYVDHLDGLIVSHDTKRCRCSELFALLVSAAEREAADGVLDPAMWAPTFPRRTRGLVAMVEKRTAAALYDKLPAVLIGVVMAYIM